MRDDRQSGPANPTRGHFFEPQKVRQQTQSLRSPDRRLETALQVMANEIAERTGISKDAARQRIMD